MSKKNGGDAPTLKSTLQRKSVACLLTALIVVITVFASGGVGLAKLRAKADDAFTAGVSGDGLSIAHDLRQRLENAGNIAIVARRYRPDDASVSAMTDAGEVLRRALDRDDRENLAEADRALAAAVEECYRALSDWGLDETDSGLVTKQYRSFLSAGDTISHDGYNRMAEEFNNARSRFPARLIGMLTGVKPLALFN